MKFCEKYSKEALPIITFMYRHFRLYLNASVKLLQCSANSMGHSEENEAIMYEVPEGFLNDYEKCKEGLTCNNFCTYFDLTTINTMIDGDVPQLNKFVAYFKKMKVYMEYPENNFLTSSVRDLETLMDLNNEEIGDSQVFFTSKLENKEMDKPNTKVYESTGVDLYDVTDNNSYPFFVESVGVIKVWSLALLFCMFAFKL